MTTGEQAGCHGCGGLADSMPIEVTNRPKLAAIAYRTGTYGRFRASMLAGLSRADRPGLADLRTRETDDFSIALIDAWAVASDVLTFYTERIANENYLGTATERRSVSDLAALLGYRLDPGVAAETWLAIALETAPSAPPESAIPAGTRVQTVAGPGEVPQVFETTEAVNAIGEWNRPRVRLLEPRIPRTGDAEVLLAGAAVPVRRGDRLLFVADDWIAASTRWQVVRVTDVATDAAAQTTTATFAPSLAGFDLAGSGVSVHVLHSQAALFGYNAPNPLLFESTILSALKADPPDLVDDTNEWRFAEVSGQEVLLDGLYDGVEPGGWAVLTSGTSTILAPVDGVRETAASAYALSARVTALHLGRADADLAGVGGPATRASIVSFRSEQLPLAEVAVTAPLSGDSIPLAQEIAAALEPRRLLVRGARARAAPGSENLVDGGFPVGDLTPIVVSVDTEIGQSGLHRWVLRPQSGNDVTILGPPGAVRYTAARADDEIVGEVATVEAAPAGPIDALLLAEPLTNVYDLQGGAPIDLFGNIADATHGERVPSEVLGSGDGARPFQRFVLRKKPVTYVQAATTTGGDSTLEVRVNGILWHEVPILFGAGPRDRVYTTVIDETGATTITFGDGVTGARLPTGVDNVVATYRAGLGLAGSARAEQISLPMTRPLGLKSAINPLPAGGAQDGQATEDARTNAPRSVLTLGRVVALQDYADFAAEFSGFAKASATWTWDGTRRGVLVTVAAANGERLPPGAALLDNLRAGIMEASNRRVRLELRDFEPAGFALLASLRIAADHDPDVVRAAVTVRLLDRYSFAERTFGEGVSLSEIVQTIHGISGVDAVHVERLQRDDEPVHLGTFLVAAAPLPGGPPNAPGAEILTLPAEGIALEVDW